MRRRIYPACHAHNPQGISTQQWPQALRRSTITSSQATLLEAWKKAWRPVLNTVRKRRRAAAARAKNKMARHCGDVTFLWVPVSGWRLHAGPGMHACMQGQGQWGGCHPRRKFWKGRGQEQLGWEEGTSNQGMHTARRAQPSGRTLHATVRRSHSWSSNYGGHCARNTRLERKTGLQQKQTGAALCPPPRSLAARAAGAAQEQLDMPRAKKLCKQWAEYLEATAHSLMRWGFLARSRERGEGAESPAVAGPGRGRHQGRKSRGAGATRAGAARPGGQGFRPGPPAAGPAPLQRGAPRGFLPCSAPGAAPPRAGSRRA